MLNLIFAEKYLWISKVVIGIILLFILQLILSLILKLIKGKSHLKKVDWRSRAHKLFYNPIKILIWIIALSYIILVISEKFHFELVSHYLYKIRNIAIILDITWLVLRWKNQILNQVIRKEHKYIDKASVEFIGKIMSLAIWFVAILIILQRLGVNVMPLVAFGGIGAAAIGFAAKDVIANFFGGLVIHITKTFRGGETIEIVSKNIKGEVQRIGWYNTCIVEESNSAIYVPNSLFLTTAIRNISRSFEDKKI